MHANGDIEGGYPPASRGALVGATPLLVTGTDRAAAGARCFSHVRVRFCRRQAQARGW
jgi:hypothetical protein